MTSMPLAFHKNPVSSLTLDTSVVSESQLFALDGRSQVEFGTGWPPKTFLPKNFSLDFLKDLGVHSARTVRIPSSSDAIWR